MHNCVYLRQFRCKENCPQLPYNWKPISSQLTCICMSGWLFLRLLTPALSWTQIKGIPPPPPKKKRCELKSMDLAGPGLSPPRSKTRVLANDKSSITAAWHHWYHEFQGHSRKKKYHFFCHCLYTSSPGPHRAALPHRLSRYWAVCARVKGRAHSMLRKCFIWILWQGIVFSHNEWVSFSTSVSLKVFGKWSLRQLW